MTAPPPLDSRPASPPSQHWLASYVRTFPRILAVGIVCGAVALGTTYLLRPRYEAFTEFVTAQSSNASLPSGGIAALASQFGLGMSGGTASPEFYAALLATRAILDPVLQDSFRTATGTTVRLQTFLDAGGKTPGERLERAAKRLSKRLDISVDDATQIVTLGVELRDPNLAADVARRLVAELDTYNQVTQRTEARARREFIQGQLGNAQRDLGAAEDSLRDFLVHNRRLDDSPTLQFEQARYQRAIDLRQAVVQDLSQAFEQARIDEVRDTPVLTVLQPALVPIKKSWPRRSVSAIAGMVVGILLALAFTTWRELQRRDPDARRLAKDLYSAAVAWRHAFSRRA